MIRKKKHYFKINKMFSSLRIKIIYAYVILLTKIKNEFTSILFIETNSFEMSGSTFLISSDGYVSITLSQYYSKLKIFISVSK